MKYGHLKLRVVKFSLIFVQKGQCLEFLHMKTVNMQQLCSFAQNTQKIDDKFILFSANDAAILKKFRTIGCRVMLLVFSGKLDVEVNGKNISLERCDFMDILEGTSFRVVSGSRDMDFYCILTSREFMVEVLQNIVPGPKDYFSILLVNPVLRLSSNATSKLFRQMRLVDDALSDMGHNYRSEMVRTYFKGVVLELGNLLVSEQHLPAVEMQTLAKKDAIMANFMDLVWKNFREKREVSFYAMELCVSTKHLARVVKSCTGKTPHAVIDAEVLGLAIQLLKNEDMLVQQVADHLHFSDQAAFSKFFRKYMRMSPTEYRRNAD